VHIGLAAMQSLHAGWVGGMRLPGLPAADGGVAPGAEPTALPDTISALLVGLHDRGSVLSVQREIAESRAEPLMAVLPGVALDGLWQITGNVERTLRLMGAVVAAVSLAGLVAVVLAGLEPRRRELAILRAIGASPRHVLALITIEGLLVTTTGVLIGLLLHALALWLLAEPLQARLGITIPWSMPNPAAWAWLAGVLVSGLLASLVPAARAYRLSLADGLSPKE
jgi:putative ABC transport system permease protein